MTVLRAILLLAVLLSIAAVTLWEAETRLSPGPLHPVHQRDASLAAADGCVLCHGEGRRPDAMAQACGECHTAIRDQLGTESGLHASLPAETARACGTCHREHHGAALPPIAALSWQRAGVEDASRYDHRRHLADHPLHGAHDDLACRSCHRHADAELLPPRTHRFLGLDPDCRSCHEDVHEGTFGSDCARCHGQERPFADAPGFRHDVFPLDGAHRQVRCSDCHDPAGQDPVAARLVRPADATRSVRRCADCHDDPHRESGSALRFAGPADDCAGCHDTERFADTAFGAGAHAARGIVLRGAHAETTDCAGCHAPDRVAARARHGADSDTAMQRCGSCHDHPHRPRLLEHTESASCSPCHLDTDREFAAGRLAPAQHDLAATGFALTAPHDAAACAECHADPGAASGYAARHPGRAPDDCRACHGDPHSGEFDGGPVAERLTQASTQADCLRCHAPTAFTPHQFGLAMHERVTGFPLAGAHRAVGCSGCHGAQDGEEPRRFGGAPTACGDCHQDPHAGRFDRPGLPTSVGGRVGCARCHTPSDFRATAHGEAAFDHALWTGHRLEGRHAAARCVDCHGRSPAGTLGPAPVRCADCHDDVHAGQFARWDGARRIAPADCARCHDAAGPDFSIAAFDHAARTDFALDANHRGLACADCHRGVTTPGGRAVVRYRPLPTDCRACHLPAAGSGGRR